MAAIAIAYKHLTNRVQLGDNRDSRINDSQVMQRPWFHNTSRHLLSLGMLVVSIYCVQETMAQNTPLISGAVGYLSTTNAGSTFFSPTIMPLIAAPIGRHFLFESRDYLLESITPRGAGQSDQTKLFEGVSYLQMDYLATKNMTFVAGKFLTPFATYNERLTPIWISNFQDEPLIGPIGTINGTGTGGMVKGSLVSTSKIKLDYAAYLSANITAKQFQAEHSVGGRIEAYFPASRLEVGTSYGRLLQGIDSNSSGFHVWWQPWSVPLAVRSEYAHSTHAQGYWVETAYRLSQWHGPTSILGRLEPVFRMQQVFRNSPGSSDGLPAADTQRVDFAMDYHLPHEIRVNTSYARQFSQTGDKNVWETGIIYRFLFPAWPGKQ
jgi:hypothetical protein